MKLSIALKICIYILNYVIEYSMNMTLLLLCPSTEAMEQMVEVQKLLYITIRNKTLFRTSV